MRYRFILENNKSYPVEKMCKYMRVSTNAYYCWLKASKKENNITSVSLLKERIKVLFFESREVYGSYRIKKMLEREGLDYSRSYIACLMQKMGIKSVLKRKFVVTTDSNHSYPPTSNILNREFETNVLGKKWVSDITYIRVNDEWNYLTTMIDLADKKVVGWSLSEDMTAENTILKAWYSARNSRIIEAGFILHSDRGVQYACKKVTSLLQMNTKVVQSMSRKGNCLDNAVAESFFKTIKYECLYRYKFTSYNELHHCIDDYITWYNTKRIHSSLNYKTPLEKEIQLRKFIKNVA